MERLDGKRIIITGGAGGMGRTTVENFPSLGAKVAFFDVNDAAGAEVEKISGAKYIHVDVSNEESVQNGFKEAVEWLGGLDVVIHCAAIAPATPIEYCDFATWKKLFAINADGTYLVDMEAFKYMKDQGHGNIINFTSASAFIVSPFQPIYGATKGAVTSWSRTLAKDLMPYNIRVNMIAPNIWTPMTDALVAQFNEEEKAAFMAGMKGLMLGDRPGDLIEDYLPVIAFAASDSSKFITGQTICVDGGTMMVR